MKREVAWKVVDKKTHYGSNVSIFLKHEAMDPYPRRGDEKRFINNHPGLFPKYNHGSTVVAYPNSPGIFCFKSLDMAEMFCSQLRISDVTHIWKVEGIDKKDDPLCLFASCGSRPSKLRNLLEGFSAPKAIRNHLCDQQSVMDAVVRFDRVTVLKSNDEGWAKEKARELLSWLEDACGDAALGMIEMNDCGQHQARFNRLKKENPHWDKYTHSSWLADDLYSDVDEIFSLLADRIYDTSRADADRKEVCLAIKERAHRGIQQACDAYIKHMEQ